MPTTYTHLLPKRQSADPPVTIAQGKKVRRPLFQFKWKAPKVQRPPWFTVRRAKAVPVNASDTRARQKFNMSMLFAVVALVLVVASMMSPQTQTAATNSSGNPVVLISPNPNATITATPYQPTIDHGTCPENTPFMPMYGQTGIDIRTFEWNPGTYICVPEWDIFVKFLTNGETDPKKIATSQNFDDYIKKEAYIGYTKSSPMLGLDLNLVEALKASFLASFAETQPPSVNQGRHGFLHLPDMALIQEATTKARATKDQYDSLPKISPNTVVQTVPLTTDASAYQIQKACADTYNPADCEKWVTGEYNAAAKDKQTPALLIQLVQNFKYTPATPTLTLRQSWESQVASACAQAINPTQCATNVLADIEAKGVVSDEDMQLLVKRHMADADTYSAVGYTQMGDKLCNIAWSQKMLTLSEVANNASSLANIIWQNTTRLYVFEAGDYFGNYLFAYSPADASGISSVCFFMDANPRNINGKYARWVMTSQQPGTVELGTTTKSWNTYVIGNATLSPIAYPVANTSVPAPYIPTTLPNFTPIVPEPSATRPPQPACVVVDWANLIAGGTGYQSLVSLGDASLQTNGWASDSALGMQVEWAGLGSGTCYYVTNIPATVYATTGDGSVGTWHYDSHGATISLGGPGYPGNAYEGKVQGASVEVWVFAINK